MHSSLKSIFQGDQGGFSGLAANYKSLKKEEDVIKRIILVCKSESLQSVYEC